MVEEVLGIFFLVEEMSPLNLTAVAVTPVETSENPGWCASTTACWIVNSILKLCSVLLPFFQRILSNVILTFYHEANYLANLNMNIISVIIQRSAKKFH